MQSAIFRARHHFAPPAHHDGRALRRDQSSGTAPNCNQNDVSGARPGALPGRWFLTRAGFKLRTSRPTHPPRVRLGADHRAQHDLLAMGAKIELLKDAGKPAPSLMGGRVGHTERGPSHRASLKSPPSLACPTIQHRDSTPRPASRP